MSRADKEAMSLEAAQSVLDRLCIDDFMDLAPQDDLVRAVAREMREAEVRFRRREFNRKPRRLAA